MSFIYPRTVSITRQTAQSGGGLKPYGGVDPGEEVTLYAGLSASIQQKSTGARPDPRLPADAANRTFWRIFMPLSAGVTPGSVQRGDIATDDTGQRYFIEAPYINSLGANFLVERLEA